MTPAFSKFASAERCAGDPLCERIHRQQPYLPIAPTFDPGLNNPCVKHGRSTACIPPVHVLGGWHCLVETALTPVLRAHPQPCQLRQPAPKTPPRKSQQ